MKNVLLCFVLMFLSTSIFSQQTILLEDFEDATTTYTTSVPEFTDGGTDYFIRTDGSNISANVELTNKQGTSFFGAQDTNGEGGPSEVQIDFSNINISGYTNLMFSFFVAEDDDGSNQDWDGNSSVSASVSIDGQANIELFVISAPGLNTEPRFDGTSTFITSEFTEYTFSIPDVGDNMELTIFINNLNDGDEDIAIDDIKISGTPPSSSVVGFDNATSSVNETNTSFTADIPVTLSNYQSSDVDLSVTVTGGTAEAGDFTLTTSTLSFSGNGTQNVSLMINDDVDFDDETVEITIAETSGTGAIVSPSVHTLTIIDDEMQTFPNVRINEVDADTETDAEEFIELFGTPNLSLDGVILVLFNGNGDVSYRTVDLMGFSLDANGYFILGSSNAPGNPDIILGSNNQIQNGADAIALYLDDASNFPGGTAPTTTNLIDALVYDTNDADDTELLNGLGQTEQINEAENGNPVTESIQRGSWFVASPTPRSENMVPIELSSFSGERQNSFINLHWTTSQEINNDYFNVQRSSDMVSWSNIGRVKGHGDSNQEIDYSFTDRNPTNGINYYRLAQFDYNGEMEYHRVIAIEMERNITEVFPTIAKHLVNVRVEEPTYASLFNQDGRLLEKIYIDKNQTIDVSDFAPGMYYLKLNSGNTLETHRFIKQ